MDFRAESATPMSRRFSCRPLLHSCLYAECRPSLLRNAALKRLSHSISFSDRFKTNSYIQLARLDKPIGTWLLFWPCGMSQLCRVVPACLTWVAHSLVHHNGFNFWTSRTCYLGVESSFVWHWSPRHERSGMHNQRYVGH